MPAAFVLLAAALSAPSVDQVFAKRMSIFFPQWALSEHAQSVADVDLTVMPNGIVARCLVVEAFGSSRLASEACAATVGLKLAPATDETGMPAYGILRVRMQNRLFAPFVKTLSLPPVQPDVELTVGKLPGGIDEMKLKLAVRISVEGKIVGCREYWNPINASAAYIAIACDRAKSVPAIMLRTHTGEGVAYVKNLAITFRRQISP